MKGIFISALFALIVPYGLSRLEEPDDNYQYCGIPGTCSERPCLISFPWQNCEGGICVCEENTFAYCQFIPGECYFYPKKIDDFARCGLNKHCVQATGEGIEDHAYCYKFNPGTNKYGTCDCKEREGISLKVEVDSLCWPIITGEGRKCEHSEQCNGSNQVCIVDTDAGEKRCKCHPEFVDEAEGEDLSCVKITDEITPCDIDEQCEGPNQFCDKLPEEKGFCKCANGYLDVNNNETDYSLRCLKEIENEIDECEFDMQCIGEHQICTEISGSEPKKQCRCNEEYVDSSPEDPESIFCIKITDETTPCTNEKQCEGEHLECILDEEVGDGKMYCRCQQEYVDVIPEETVLRCLEKISVDDKPCEDPLQCGNPHQTCAQEENGPTKYCQCEAGFIDIHDKNNTLRCLEEITNETEECEFDLQCIGNHQICTEVSGSESKKQCRCNEEYVDSSPDDPENLVCVKITDETTPCTNEKQCEGDHLECVLDVEVGDEKMYCRCQQEFVDVIPEDTGLRCLEKISVDDKPCEDPLQCGDPHQTCAQEENGSMKYCQCGTGFVDIHDKNNTLLCLPEIDDGITECQSDLQCVGDPNAVCLLDGNNQRYLCQCISTHVDVDEEDGLECLIKISNEVDICEHSKQCEDVGAVCSGTGTQKTCQCQDEFLDPIDGEGIMCYEKMPINGDCSHAIQCQHLGYGSCLDGKCDCIGRNEGESFYHDDTFKCYKFSVLNERCELPEQCEKVDSGSGLEGAALVQCSQPEGSSGDKVCNCLDNGFPFAAPEDLTKCWLTITTDNVECHFSEQCQAINTECALVEDGSRQLCQCNSDNVDVQEGEELNCFNIVTEEGAPCHGYPQVCTKGMGENADCNPSTGYCQCQDQFLYFPDNTREKCFVPKQLGQHCAAKGECAVVAGPLTECDDLDQRCRCAQSAVNAEGKCWERKIVGSPCNATKECDVTIDGSVRCDFIGGEAGGVCKCAAGSEEDLGGTACSQGMNLRAMNTTLILWGLLWGLQKVMG